MTGERLRDEYGNLMTTYENAGAVPESLRLKVDAFEETIRNADGELADLILAGCKNVSRNGTRAYREGIKTVEVPGDVEDAFYDLRGRFIEARLVEAESA